MNNIKELRKQKGHSQEQLANILGLDQTSVSSWERGVCLPNVETIAKLADYFNVSIDYLLGYSRYHYPVNVGKDNVFTFEELEIIEQYRSLPDNLKRVVKDTLTTFASAEKK